MSVCVVFNCNDSANEREYKVHFIVSQRVPPIFAKFNCNDSANEREYKVHFIVSQRVPPIFAIFNCKGKEKNIYNTLIFC